jgi:hypothetical protein
MAFPGSYNFNYYKGDTFEFKLYPKTSNGSPFPLDTYLPSNGGGGAGFTLATDRGSAGVSGQIECDATISLVDNSITCVISPTNGNQLISNNQYVYDVEISKGSGNTATVFTIVTGLIDVTDQVTGATA